MNLREILHRVMLDGKFYTYCCEGWRSYGWRLGHLCYETRHYQGGRIRSALMTRRGILVEFGREGENMEPHICRTCKKMPDCKKSASPTDFCVTDWESKMAPDARLWDALQEAIEQKNLNKIVQIMNHRYLVGEGR